MPVVEDKHIVKKVIEGETELFRLLVEKYQHPVYKAVFRIVGNIEDAKDVTQDVFIKAYESLYQYNDQYKFFSWLYRIAINSALLFVKSQKKERSIDNMPIIPELADTTTDKEQWRHLIGQCINQLPDKYKAVIVLKYYTKISYNEIAETLGIPEKKVKSRLFDARKLLKERLVKVDIFNLMQ